MPQIRSIKSDGQELFGARIPAGTSRSSTNLSLSALHSIQKLQLGTGIGEASENLYQVAIRTFEGFYAGPLGVSFSIRDAKEVAREEISPILTEIYNLLTWPEGWNGYDACAPKYEAVQYADHWIELFYQEVIGSGQSWIEPNVTASAEGEVVFEWRRGIKSLTVFIGNEIAEYVKDWGTDINTEMEDGYVNSPSIRHALWKWLMN
ncbi:MAG: hypothetical protein NVS4B12_16070 [Ktedonobacteraceae bacterium]